MNRKNKENYKLDFAYEKYALKNKAKKAAKKSHRRDMEIRRLPRGKLNFLSELKTDHKKNNKTKIVN